MIRRLVCVVEGHGEVKAIPNLVSRILRYLSADNWLVDEDPIRQPRSRLVGTGLPGMRGRANRSGLESVLAMVRARRASGVIILVDADDDCPAEWGPEARAIVTAQFPGTAVMAVREYENWLLLSRVGVAARKKAEKRDAKSELAKLVPGYKPSTHQLVETRRMSIEGVRSSSDSFEKLVRDIGVIAGRQVPPR